MIGKARARHGSTVIWSPSLNLRMWSWQVAVPVSGPCARPLIIIEHEPQMPSRQSWSKATGSSSVGEQPLVEHVEQLEERHVGADVRDVVVLEPAPARWAPPGARPGASGPYELRSPVRVVALGEVDVLELERFLVELRRGVDAGRTPTPRRTRSSRRRGGPRRPRSGARRGSDRRSSLRAAARRAEQLAELEEVGDAAGLLERLVERLVARRAPSRRRRTRRAARGSRRAPSRASPGCGPCRSCPTGCCRARGGSGRPSACR